MKEHGSTGKLSGIDRKAVDLLTCLCPGDKAAITLQGSGIGKAVYKSHCTEKRDGDDFILITKVEKDGKVFATHLYHSATEEESLYWMSPSEFKNVCAKCGAVNTLWPLWRGRKRFYQCDACKQPSKGITQTEALKQGLVAPCPLCGVNYGSAENEGYCGCEHRETEQEVSQ